MSEPIKGTDQWGREYTEESPEVKEYMARFPDVSLEAAIGSVLEVINAGKGPDEL